MIAFEELKKEVKASGYTDSANELDDLFLRELPNEYYCFWRVIWRKTYGWQKTEDSLSLRSIAKYANISTLDANRAAWFFHLFDVISFQPGHENVSSHFELFPKGTIEIEDMKRLVATLKPVILKEKAIRKNNKDFRYTISQFTRELTGMYQSLGGQVADVVLEFTAA